MDKLYISNLALEITRKCNMKCPHCMRGEPENKDLNIQCVEELLSNVAFIGNLAFCGGEPSLNVKGIKDTLELCKKYNIPVLSIDIVTNGKKISDSFLKVILE